MRFRLFGPPQEEIDEVASDLIARHGLNAYDEAVHLAKVAQLLPRSLRQRKIYELAAVRDETRAARCPLRFLRFLLIFMGTWLATPAGLEPATCRLEGGCSIQLSYGAFLRAA
jgi:hypothetical protein